MVFDVGCWDFNVGFDFNPFLPQIPYHKKEVSGFYTNTSLFVINYKYALSLPLQGAGGLLSNYSKRNLNLNFFM
jgi:hypothetical protein